MSKDIAAISKWIDGFKSYEGLDPEAHLWRRVTKVGAEAGEVFDAMSGYTGENPRKGQTHTINDVIEELLDTAVAALGAVEHITGNQGQSVLLLSDKIKRVRERAGV